jgi:hypothetical protein
MLNCISVAEYIDLCASNSAGKTTVYNIVKRISFRYFQEVRLSVVFISKFMLTVTATSLANFIGVYKC